MIDPMVLPAVLGWANADGGENVRLYALDRGKSPRWDNGGRTVERAIVEADGGNREGDRYLIVRLGDRFVSDEDATRISAAITELLETG